MCSRTSNFSSAPKHMLASCFTVGLIAYICLFPHKLYFESSQLLCAFTWHSCLWKAFPFIWWCNLFVFGYLNLLLGTKLPDFWLDLTYLSAKNVIVLQFWFTQILCESQIKITSVGTAISLNTEDAYRFIQLRILQEENTPNCGIWVNRFPFKKL